MSALLLLLLLLLLLCLNHDMFCSSINLHLPRICMHPSRKPAGNQWISSGPVTIVSFAQDWMLNMANLATEVSLPVSVGFLCRHMPDNHYHYLMTLKVIR